MNMQLIKTFQFEAAHRTSWHGDPVRLHGHSYRVDVIVEGPLDAELGWVVDYAEITRLFEPLFAQLDHRTLNDVDGLGDSSLSGISRWIENGLRSDLPILKDVQVSIVGDEVYSPRLESRDATLGLPERVRFGFEAAHALTKLPSDHKCHAMHGHSFLVEVASSDNATLTANLQTLYDRLDHRCLNDISGLENPTSEEVSRWVWSELTDIRSDIKAVVVAETCTAKCVYRGEG